MFFSGTFQFLGNCVKSSPVTSIFQCWNGKVRQEKKFFGTSNGRNSIQSVDSDCSTQQNTLTISQSAISLSLSFSTLPVVIGKQQASNIHSTSFDIDYHTSISRASDHIVTEREKRESSSPKTGWSEILKLQIEFNLCKTRAIDRMYANGYILIHKCYVNQNKPEHESELLGCVVVNEWMNGMEALDRATMHSWGRLDIQLRFNDDGIEIKRVSENWSERERGGGVVGIFNFIYRTTKRVRNDRRWLDLTFHILTFYLQCSRKLTNMYTSGIRLVRAWMKLIESFGNASFLLSKCGVRTRLEMIEKSKVIRVEFDWIFVQFPLNFHPSLLFSARLN